MEDRGWKIHAWSSSLITSSIAEIIHVVKDRRIFEQPFNASDSWCISLQACAHLPTGYAVVLASHLEELRFGSQTRYGYILEVHVMSENF